MVKEEEEEKKVKEEEEEGMRALMATSRGPEGGFSVEKWKTHLVLLMVLVIGASVESSQKADGSEQSERGLMVVTHTSGETRQKRAGEDAFGHNHGDDRQDQWRKQGRPGMLVQNVKIGCVHHLHC